MLDFYNYIFKSFITKKLPYPSGNPNIQDEITASIAFGKIPDFTYGTINNKTAPYYPELLDRKVREPGIIIHFWSSDYKTILFKMLEKKYPKVVDELCAHIFNILITKN